MPDDMPHRDLKIWVKEELFAAAKCRVLELKQASESTFDERAELDLQLSRLKKFFNLS